MENRAASVVNLAAVSQLTLSCVDFNLQRGGDGRRLEVVVDGVPRFGGAQLAVDTTFVSTLHGDGSARRRVDEDGSLLVRQWATCC